MKTLRLMRVHHYIKNVLIFLPLIFSGQLFRPGLFVSTLWGTLAFCLMTSIVYIVNDIRDLEKDRRHPTKCRRPLASGELSVAYAKKVIIVLVAAIAAILLLGGHFHMSTILYMLIYMGLNLGYSFGLKNYPIIDIVILVSGFLLRMIYGSSLTGIEVSSWLYLTVMSISFYLGFGKRRNEFRRTGSQSREVLKYYTYEFLDKNMVLFLALSDVFYSLWCVNMIDSGRYGHLLLWTVPMVLVIEMRYSLDVEGEYDGDPVEVMYHDRVLIGLVSCYGLIMLMLLYLR